MPVGPMGSSISEGDPLLGDPGTLAGAASSTLPSVSDAQQLAQLLAQRLATVRSPVPNALMTGSELPSPTMPRPPLKATPQGAIPQGPFGSVGERKRADTQAIFNTAGNLLNKIQERQYQEKVNRFKRDYETMASAIRGYNEGEATGNKEQMKHNADILNRLLADDPKTAKELSKGMNVNLNPMAEGKHKGKDKPDPANDAFKATFAKDLKEFQEKSAKGEPALAPQVKAMMRATPQTLQTDPRFASYLEGLQRGAYPKAGEMLTFEKGIRDVQEKIVANAVTNETKQKMAENLGAAMLDRTKMQQYGATLRTQMMQLGATDRANIMADAWKYRADKTLQGQSERTSVLREKLNAAGTDTSKKLLTLMKGLDDAAKKNSKDIEDAKKDHDMERLKWLNQQADGIAYQQRLVNDQAERQVGIDPQEPPDKKNMGLSDDEMMLFQEIFKDQTQPAGGSPEE